MLRYCTGVSEGLHSLQCYCPRLRHPEVINGLWGLPSRTPPRQKTLGWKSGTPLGCFTSAPRSRQKTLPLPSRVAAGKGTEERAGVCTCPPPRVVSHSRDGNGNGPGVAAERALAPTRWQQEKSRLHLSLSCFHSIGVGVSSAESPPPPSPQPFCHCRGILQILFVTPVTFLPRQQGRGAPTGEASRRAQPPAASTAALSSAALRRTESTHSRGCGTARETSLRDTLNAHGERVPLFGSPFHQSQPGRKGRRVKCRHFWPCPPVQVVHSP